MANLNYSLAFGDAHPEFMKEMLESADDPLVALSRLQIVRAIAVEAAANSDLSDWSHNTIPGLQTMLANIAPQNALVATAIEATQKIIAKEQTEPSLSAIRHQCPAHCLQIPAT